MTKKPIPWSPSVTVVVGASPIVRKDENDDGNMLKMIHEPLAKVEDNFTSVLVDGKIHITSAILIKMV